MSKTFFDELYITALMAAPSVGRRSCAGQREAAALISQSRRLIVWACQRAAERRLFFFCRRPADTSYYHTIFFSKILAD